MSDTLPGTIGRGSGHGTLKEIAQSVKAYMARKGLLSHQWKTLKQKQAAARKLEKSAKHK